MIFSPEFLPKKLYFLNTYKSSQAATLPMAPFGTQNFSIFLGGQKLENEPVCIGYLKLNPNNHYS